MKKYLILLLFFSILIISACATNKETTEIITNKNEEPKTINEGVYKINTETSQINWRAEKIVGPGHDGSVKIKDGSFSLNKESGQGSAIIDMKTIIDADNNESLIKHLESADFFDVENFSESSINLTKITPKQESANQYEVQGDLIIKGISNPINFEVTATKNEDSLTLTGPLSIDRTLWNIRFGSDKFFDNLGDKAIKNNIDYNILINADLIK